MNCSRVKLATIILLGGLSLAAPAVRAQAVCQLPETLLNVRAQRLGYIQEDFNLLRSRFQVQTPRTWSVLVEGSSVPLSTQFVSVLPQQATCWSQFRSWSVATKDIFYKGSSWWRGTSWDLNLKVVAAFGELRSSQKIKGRWVEKRGKYIGYLTVVPELISKGPRGAPVARPDFFADVKVLGVYNMGTRLDPIATVDLLVTFSRQGERQSRMVQVHANGLIEIVDTTQVRSVM